MAHESYEVLEAKLSNAAAMVALDSLWRHYKTRDIYRVTDLLIEESTDEPGVEYVSVEHPQVKMFRPLASWLEHVEVDGVVLRRFELVESSDS